jgi:GLPGLI family protein
MFRRKYILIFLISVQGFAQNSFMHKATYRANYNFDIPYSNLTELIYNKSESYFSVGDDILNDSENEVNILTYNDNFQEIYHTNFKENIILSKQQLLGKVIFIKENIIKIPWEIDVNEKKMIIGYNCTKATGTFRGRQYIVWFTEEIPFKFGPWKLNGLPGMILEAFDAYSEVSFTIEKIENFKKPIVEKFDFPDKRNKYEIIDLKEYVLKKNEEVNSQIDLIISKLPRESKVSNIKRVKYKGGVELKYEWEERSQ